MRIFSDFVVRTSSSLPLFLLALALGPLTLTFGLFPLMEAFTEVTGGVQPFDWINGLTATDIADQKALYTGVAREIYLAHTFFDFLFPWFMGVFLGAIPAYFLRKGAPGIDAFINKYSLYAFFLLTALFDILENFGALGVIMQEGGADSVWANVLLFGKQVKLVVQQIIPLLTLAGVLAGAGGWIAASLRRH